MFDWLIHSKTRLRMLKLFFRDVSRPLYGLEISQKLGASPGTTHRELNAMLKKKILVKKKEGALVLYQLNTKHPHFLELQLTVKPPAKTDTILFVSDIHLDDTPDPSRLEDLIKLTDYAAKNASELVLLGDIFETVEGDFLLTWLYYQPAIQKLMELAQQIPVTYVLGNHDVLFSAMIKEGEGFFFNSKIRLTQVYSNPKQGIHAEHGHRINASASGLKKPSPSNKGALLEGRLKERTIGGDTEYFQKLREVSEETQYWSAYHITHQGDKNWYPKALKDQLQEAQKLLKQEQIRYVVMGHTHQAIHKSYKSGDYLNPGTWKPESAKRHVIEIDKRGARLKLLTEL